MVVEEEEDEEDEEDEEEHMQEPEQDAEEGQQEQQKQQRLVSRLLVKLFLHTLEGPLRVRCGTGRDAGEVLSHTLTKHTQVHPQKSVYNGFII